MGSGASSGNNMPDPPASTDQRELLSEAVDKIRICFEQADTDKSGVLTYAEFAQLCRNSVSPNSELQRSVGGKAFLKQTFSLLDANSNGVIEISEFIDWWAARPGGEDGDARGAAMVGGDDPSKRVRRHVLERMDRLRRQVGAKADVFYGFSFDDWLMGKALAGKPIASWTPREVFCFLATSESLKVLRPYLSPAAFEDIDGETLLELRATDWESKGILRYHVKKLRLVIDEVRQAQLLGAAGQADPAGVSVEGGSRNGAASSGVQPHSPQSKFRVAKRQSVERAQQQLRWKRGELIGTGAFGRVFKALNEDTGALLAVKELTRIQPSSDANMNTHTNAAAARSGERERAEKARLELANEILLLKSLEHPNIVRYLGVELTEEYLYIITEWMPGGSVENIIQRFGRLSECTITCYTEQLLAGLAYLHAPGVPGDSLRHQGCKSPCG